MSMWPAGYFPGQSSGGSVTQQLIAPVIEAGASASAPALTSAGPPLRPISMPQGTAITYKFPVLTDSQGVPINPTGHSLRLVVYKRGSGKELLQVDAPDIYTESTPSGVIVCVTFSAVATARAIDADYVIHDLTDDLVLWAGAIQIVTAPEGQTPQE